MYSQHRIRSDHSSSSSSLESDFAFFFFSFDAVVGFEEIVFGVAENPVALAAGQAVCLHAAISKGFSICKGYVLGV